MFSMRTSNFFKKEKLRNVTFGQSEVKSLEVYGNLKKNTYFTNFQGIFMRNVEAKRKKNSRLT